MSRNYQKPPLVEALCEFQFDSESWDWTIPGIIYQEISKRFPKKRQLNKFEFQLLPEVKEISQPSRGEAERMQFLSEDEGLLIQVGPNMLAVNSVSSYPHWEIFRELIQEMFGVYCTIAKPSSIKRIGLRYINRIDIPEPRFEFSTYFNLEPKLPDGMPQDFASVFLRVELPYLPEKGILVLTFGSSPDKKPEQASFILDLDFVTLKNQSLQFEECEDWVETAHTQVETAFEACVTEHLRIVFLENKQ